jgi:hypothetical protein
VAAQVKQVAAQITSRGTMIIQHNDALTIAPNE